MNTDKKEYEISVIMPCYNTEKYVEETLKSVLNQSFKNYEIICLNDGSTDGTVQILNKYQKLYSNIRVISNENHGVAYERNIGIQSSKGKYIYYMDSDDLIRENCLETLYNYAENDKLDVVYFEADSFYETEEIKKDFPQFQTLYHRKKEYKEVYNGHDLYIQMEQAGDIKMSVGLQFARRDFLIENNIHFEEMRAFEDNLYTLQVMLKADKVRCVKDSLYLRRVRSDSIMTGKVNKVRFEAYNRIIKELLELLEKESQDSELQDALYKRIRGTFINIYKDYSKVSIEEKLEIFESKNRELLLFAEISCFINIEEKERKEVAEKLKKAYTEKSEINAKLQKTYAEKSEINAKLQKTYAEKSEINAKLQKTYAEKSEINAKLKKAYEEKKEHSERIKKLKNKVATQKERIQEVKSVLNKTTDQLDEANKQIKLLKKEKEELEKHLLVRVIKKICK